MKYFLFVAGLFVSCSTNPVLRDRNIIRHDQEKLHQLLKELDVETSSQAHKRVHNINTLLKELNVATVDDVRQEIKKLRKNKQKLRTLKDKIGGNNFKQVKQRVNKLNDYLVFENAQTVNELYKKRQNIPLSLKQLAQTMNVKTHDADQIVQDLQLEIFQLKHNYQQVQSELTDERAHKQELHDRLEQVNQLLGH